MDALGNLDFCLNVLGKQNARGPEGIREQREAHHGLKIPEEVNFQNGHESLNGHGRFRHVLVTPIEGSNGQDTATRGVELSASLGGAPLWLPPLLGPCQDSKFQKI